MKMSSSKIKHVGSLAENLKVFGTFIRKQRTKKNLTIEELASDSFLRPETIRRIESARCLTIPNDDIRRLEKSLGLRPNVLIIKSNLHKEYLVQFINIYHDHIIAMVDALRLYQPDEIDRILNDTVFKWTQNSARKESEESMATTRRMTPAAKPAVKAAPKRATKTATKTAPTKRASSSRSAKR